DTLLNGVANPLANNMESGGLMRADSSIWEVHDANKKHYTYTSLAAARGFCDMATLAQRAQKDTDKTRFQMLSQKVNGAIQASLLDSGALAGTLEFIGTGRAIDASVVEAFN